MEPPPAPAHEYFYYDLQERCRHETISALFPGWAGSDEMVVVLAPHDDDAVLGPGYLIRAVLANGGRMAVVIFNDGRAGYSDPAMKDEIVALRTRETRAALEHVGVPRDRVFRLNFPDFSGLGRLGWVLPGGDEGTFPRLVKHLRQLRATRLVFANGHREHIDHTAVALAAQFDGPQVGDPVVVDWGAPSRIRTFLAYSVWGKFSPRDALVRGRDPAVRANWAISAPAPVERHVLEAVRLWASQGVIIEDIVANRRNRRLARSGGVERFVELYLKLDPRPRLDYAPYRALIAAIDADFDPE